MHAHLSAVGLIVLASGVVPSAQSDAVDRPRFDVVSVKPNKNSENVIRFQIQPGGRLVIVDIPVKQLIRAAYTLQLYQIVDAPSWTESERFDITGITARELNDGATWRPEGQYALVQLLMQSLLADRFNFRAHFEARQGQVYALVRDETRRPTNTLTPTRVPCGNSCGMKVGSGSLSARGVQLPQLAELLSQITGRVVTDATGLAGEFDIELRWTPESQPAGNEAPSIFTAVSEQLGLRLDARRGPIRMLVIDSVDRPTSD
jgi:uncharacterized protein (TIGR03435 family)